MKITRRNLFKSAAALPVVAALPANAGGHYQFTEQFFDYGHEFGMTINIDNGRLRHLARFELENRFCVTQADRRKAISALLDWAESRI